MLYEKSQNVNFLALIRSCVLLTMYSYSVCKVYPGGKDCERAQISGGECVVIARELPRDTARYRPKPFISGSIEN